MEIEQCEFSIIILNWNLAGYTKQCIESIIKYTNDVDYEIILVDNGSTEKESLVLMEKYGKNPLIKIIRNKENLRVVGGNNEGFKVAKGKYILMLNNDTEIKEKNWFVSTIRLFESDWQLGIIGSAGGYHDKKLNHVASFLANNRKEMQIVEYAEGWCMWIRRQVYEKLGGLDKRYFLFCEDSDYCFQAKKEGYKVVILPHRVVHFGGKTHKKKTAMLKHSQESSMKLKAKWGTPPEVAEIHNILCIRYEARGDVFLCLPAVRQLRKEYPHHFIHFLTLPACREVVERENRCIDKLWIRNEKTTKSLSKISFDLIINFQDHKKYSQDLKSLFYREYRGGKNELMQNTKESQQKRWKAGKKYVEIFGDIAQVKVENKLEFPLQKEDYNILEKYNLEKKGYICINLESCWESRHFGRGWIDHFCDLCVEKNIKCVLLGIDTGLKKANCINLIRKTTIAEAKAIIENSALFLTIDSLLLHIAQAIKDSPPIFALFTATPSNYVLTDIGKVQVFAATCFCSPCFTGFCKGKTKKACTKELSPEYLLGQVQKKISRKKETKEIDIIEVSGKPVKIDFFGAFSLGENGEDYNYGDHLILRQEKKDIAKGNAIARILSAKNIREKLIEYTPDILIIGGGGLIHPCQTASGWYFPLSMQEIDQLIEQGTKIIILAIGKNCDKNEWSHVCWENMSYLLEKSSLISGRDRNTVNFFQQHTDKKIQLCPDPALFTFMGVEQQNRGSQMLNISWTTALEKSQIWEILGRTGLDPCLLLQGSFWHNTPEHNAMLQDFAAIKLIAHEDYLNGLKGRNITLSATLHGCILSTSLGIPTLLATNVERIKGFKDLFLEDFESFPCILSWEERHLLEKLQEKDFSVAIENRKKTLHLQYKKVIKAVKELIYGK